jgi:hypothetical protein
MLSSVSYKFGILRQNCCALVLVVAVALRFCFESESLGSFVFGVCDRLESESL